MKEIPLTKGYSALVDDEDYERASEVKWYFSNGYARRTTNVDGKRGIVSLATYILDVSPHTLIDHINRNKLDCQRANMRIATTSINSHNRRGYGLVGYKGVRMNGYRYVAQIVKDGVTYYLGSFATSEEAALAYNKRAIELYGEYASINEVE